MTDWVIENLTTKHNRKSFDCGHDQLNSYLHQFANQNEKKNVSKHYVATYLNDKNVIGYYAISAGSVSFENLPANLSKKLPRNPIPVAHIGRLAVDQSTQGQGLGAYLLIDALKRITHISHAIGIQAVEVLAIDEPATNFYLKYGFTPLKDDPHHLYLPIKAVLKLNL